MRIAIVGAGAVGMLYAERWVAAGHEVVVSYTRHEDRLAEKAAAVGAGASAPRDAASGADVVLFCPPFECIADAAAQVGPLRGRVVIDTTNPFNPERTGLVELDEGDTAFRAVGRAFPGSVVVKAFHNLAVAQVIDAASRPVVFVAGDDPAARSLAATLVTDARLTSIETGELATAALSEAPGPLFMTVMDADRARVAVAAAMAR
jgi:predicted dinucleotide-binding enzyme